VPELFGIGVARANDKEHMIGSAIKASSQKIYLGLIHHFPHSSRCF
jgi:hypothetical protein